MNTTGKLIKTTAIKTAVLALTVIGWLAVTPEVRANPDLTPILDSVTPGAVLGTFDFSYSVILGTAERAQPGPGVAPPATTPTAGASGATHADYFTIYDFTGFTGGHSEPAGWAFNSLLLGSTPDGTLPGDDPLLPNLTWYRTGATLVGPVGPIAGFVATTDVGTSVLTGQFTSDATLQGGLQDGTAVGTIGSTSVPTPSNVVPEPATLLLLGSGLAGLAGWRKWSAKKN